MLLTNLTNDVVNEGLKSISGYDLLMWFLFIVGIIGALIGAGIALIKLAEKYHKTRKFQEETLEAIGKHTEDIKDLKESITDVYACIQEVSSNTMLVLDKVEDLAEKQKSMQDKQDEQDRSRIKDQIRQLYQLCHSKQSMTQIEKDTLNALIKSYEAANGVNSFVHSVVMPEMDTWTLVP